MDPLARREFLQDLMARSPFGSAATLDQERFAALQRGLVTAPWWIIDGNYASTLPIRLQAVGTVVFLDLPAWACLWGIVQRLLTAKRIRIIHTPLQVMAARLGPKSGRADLYV